MIQNVFGMQSLMMYCFDIICVSTNLEGLSPSQTFKAMAGDKFYEVLNKIYLLITLGLLILCQIIIDERKYKHILTFPFQCTVSLLFVNIWWWRLTLDFIIQRHMTSGNLLCYS